MSLQEQVVSFPLVGGVDEGTHPRLCSKLLAMVNCNQQKTGAIAKRYGTTLQGSTNALFGGGTPPAGELLAARGDELVRIGRDMLTSYDTIGSTDQVRKSFKPEATVLRDTIASGGSQALDTDVAYGSGYIVYLHGTIETSSTGQRQVIYADVVKASTGSRVWSRFTVDSTSNPAVLFSPAKVLIIGTTAVVVYRKGTTISARTLSLSTLSWSAVTALPGATGVATGLVSSGHIDACAMTDRFAVVYQTTAGSPYIHVGTWDATLATVTAPVGLGTDDTVTAYALRGVIAENLWLGYAAYDLGATSYVIKAYALDPSTLAVVAGPTTLDTTVSVAGAINVGVERLTSTTAVFMWTANFDVFWCEYDTGGVAGSSQVLRRVFLLSRPFKDSTTGHTYALVQNVHATHSTIFLVSLLLPDDDPTYAVANARVIATVAPRQVPIVSTTSGTYPRTRSSLSSVVTPTSGSYYIAAGVSGSQVESVVGSLLDVSMAATRPAAALMGDMLTLSCGAPSGYDGDLVAELGFAYEPDTSLVPAPTKGASGNMTPDSTYRYILVYEWTFANGDIVRSLPSDPDAPITVVMGASDLSVTLKVPYLHLTNKEDAVADTRLVSVIIYRTVADGATYYRATSFTLPQENLNVQNTVLSNDITDSLSDDDLSVMPLLYSQGDVGTARLGSEIPPSGSHVVAINDRVWLSGTDDDTIYFSQPHAIGEAIEFSGTLTIAPFQGGRVVGMAELDEKKIILKESGLYYIIGDGPALTGTNGSFSSPVSIPSNVGCTDARSIVSTRAGVLFMSQSGLALLDRNLQVQLVGTAVEDTTALFPNVSAAAIIPDQDIVRFALEGIVGVTADFDMKHGGAWGTSSYNAADGVPPIVAATYARDAWWYLDGNGKLFKEDTTLWTDNGAFVESRIRMRYVSLGDIQGFARVWYVSLDGNWKSHHTLSITLYVDEQASTTQTATWTDAVVSAWPRWQPQVHVAQQECEGLSVEVYDSEPTTGAVGTGEGFVLFGVSAEVGLEKPLRRVPAAQTK